MKEFERLQKIISEDDFKRLSNIKVLIIGIGGVGGYAFEALVRSGVINITIVDADNVEISNLNRQIIATHETIDMQKCIAAKNRAESINKDVKITTINKFIIEDNIDELFNTNYDYIIDACDTISTKVHLIKKAHKKNIKIISCMGAGNRFDPSKLSITEISKTSYDPVAKVIRKLLKDAGIKKKTYVVASTEKPVKTSDRIPGSIVTVPAVAGIYCASYVINDVLRKNS